MLELKNITKIYKVADLKQSALSGVSVCFRKSEFVSVLGPSGSGKTTLLNIIGGLDQYTDGDLIINGISTKLYKDRDWDNYRNHSVGFVFQSYNLIPHQSVLSNVELALTLSGVSKSERRKKAEEALKKVGLGEHIHKRPNQLSGGQMQRVAIARALINDPDILLADEPTGALDTETSVQVMELLAEVSKDRLVIMVTHNPELAEKYSGRIINLLDGKITHDSDPFYPEKEQEKDNNAASDAGKDKDKKKRGKRASMSFFTALSLSFNNLLTKKGRTVMTSFAGSIGIIGIALVLSVSSGFQAYINRVQEDTLSSYPITILAESRDMSAILRSIADRDDDAGGNEHEKDAIYVNHVMYDLVNTMNSVEVTKNDLTRFKNFLETDEEMKSYLSAVRYTYDVDFNIYGADKNGKIFDTDIMRLFGSSFGMSGSSYESSGSVMTSGMFSGNYEIWEEMLPGTNGELINETVRSQYEVLEGGRWPEAYDEAVLVVNKRNEVSDMVLYSLGLKTEEEITQIMAAAMTGRTIEKKNESWSYDDIYGLTFKLVLDHEKYVKNADGTYTNLGITDAGMEYLYNNRDIGTVIKIVGIIRPSDDAVTTMLNGSVAYTSALTQYAIEKTSNSDIIKEQLNDPSKDVISGLAFKPDSFEEPGDEEKAEAAKAAIPSMSTEQKAELYKKLKSVPSEEYLENAVNTQLSMIDKDRLIDILAEQSAERLGITDIDAVKKYLEDMDEEAFYNMAGEFIRESAKEAFRIQVENNLASADAGTLASLLDKEPLSEEDYVMIYDEFIPAEYSDSSYEDNLKLLGFVSEDVPSGIYLYTMTFEAKDRVEELIEKYNGSSEEGEKINYTDYVKILMSSITVIINAITIVLTAFVGISLVVSSIMIGIITYISVLERTKEIGILRSVGASKKDIARVFNAETLIVGFAAGIIGILVTIILLIPLNILLHALTGLSALSAVLPWAGAVILVIISMLLTFIAGLVPSKIAANKNPVEALRTE